MNGVYIPFGCVAVLGASPTEWAGRYGIEPVTHPCCECSAPRRSSVPIASRTLRGLMSPPCEVCGNERPTPYCLVGAPKTGDLFDALKEQP